MGSLTGFVVCHSNGVITVWNLDLFACMLRIPDGERGFYCFLSFHSTFFSGGALLGIVGGMDSFHFSLGENVGQLSDLPFYSAHVAKP